MSNKVIIVEDELLIRKQLTSILTKLGYEVIKECANGDLFLDALPGLEPDIILFDINIKGSRDGIELAKIVREKYNYPFIFVTSYADRNTIDAAKITRPNGYIVKPFDERDIMTSLEIALYNSSSSGNDLTKESIGKRYGINLTEREFITLTDLAQGLSNAQIASKQFVSINTVKTHLKNLFIKLDVKDRVNLIKKVL